MLDLLVDQAGCGINLWGSDRECSLAEKLEVIGHAEINRCSS